MWHLMADLATLPVYGCSIYVSLDFFGVSGSSERCCSTMNSERLSLAWAVADFIKDHHRPQGQHGLHWTFAMNSFILVDLGMDGLCTHAHTSGTCNAASSTKAYHSPEHYCRLDHVMTAPKMQRSKYMSLHCTAAGCGLYTFYCLAGQWL